MLNELQGNIAILRGALTGSDKPAIPDDYLSSLTLDVVALGRLADQGAESNDMLTLKFASKLKIENDAAAFSILRDVADDVAIKTAQLKDTRDKAPQLVQVTVRAKQEGREINDYEVWYVAKGWASVADAFNRFDNLSSPSTKFLAPGNYFLWLRKGKEATERQPFKIGGDRVFDRNIDLVVR
jgi:hypothetical protein